MLNNSKKKSEQWTIVSKSRKIENIVCIFIKIDQYIAWLRVLEFDSSSTSSTFSFRNNRKVKCSANSSWSHVYKMVIRTIPTYRVILLDSVGYTGGASQKAGEW